MEHAFYIFKILSYLFFCNCFFFLLLRNSRKSLQELPQKWLSELMEAIQSDNLTMNKLCATRRSAGVPYLVQVSLAFVLLLVMKHDLKFFILR